MKFSKNMLLIKVVLNIQYFQEKNIFKIIETDFRNRKLSLKLNFGDFWHFMISSVQAKSSVLWDPKIELCLTSVVMLTCVLRRELHTKKRFLQYSVQRPFGYGIFSVVGLKKQDFQSKIKILQGGIVLIKKYF